MQQQRLPFLCVGLLVCSLGSAATIPYALEKDSRVSLAVYNAQGQLVRTLLTGKPQDKGPHSISWDGLDRYGYPLPKGEYTWKLLASAGLRAEFITQVGQNPDPIWEKGVCNHEPPSAAAVDATGVYRIGTFDEGAHAGVKTDLNGRYLWTTDRDKVDPWCQFGAALTVLNGTLYELVHNGTLYRYDANTGRCFTSGNGNGLWNLRWEGGPAKVDVKESEKLRHYVEKTGMDLSSAAKAGLLVVSYRQHNAVRWFSVENGQQVAEASVPEPIAVAGHPDGTALVISRGAVLSVSRDGKVKTVISSNLLQSPWRLCVSPKSGEIFVAENSALAEAHIERPEKNFDSGVAQDLSAGVISKAKGAVEHHLVKRFSAEGKLRASFGKPEGRQDGIYVPTDFRGITDLEADPEGGFVITEGHQQPPRRSARFDVQGKLLHEWLGAAEYGLLACPEPGNPEYIWMHANATQGGMIRCRVNYAKKNWSIVETYRDCLARNPFWKSGHQLFRIVPREGRLHFFGTIGSFVASVYDPVKKTMRVSNASVGKNSSGDFWNDLNDDSLVQPEEMARFGQQVGGSVAGPDFALFTTPHSSGYRSGPKLTPARFTVGGTPIYEFDKASTWPAWKENGEDYRCWDIVAAPDGGWYGCFSDALKAPALSHENHGAWYYNSCSGIDRLVKWDRDWKPLWSVGRHSPDNDHETGSQAMPRNLIGTTHGCIVWADGSDEELTRSSVWTDDGLYVDEFLRVTLDGLPKEIYGLQQVLEFSSGHIAIDPATGDVLYYAVGTSGGSGIYRITGWNGWARQSGEVSLTSTASGAARRDGIGLKGEYFNNLNCSGEPVLTRTDKVVFFHWLKGVDTLPKGLDAQNGFSCRWSGQLEAPVNDTYRLVFETMTPWRGEGWGTPGAPVWLKLWLGGCLVIDTTNGLARLTTFGTYGQARLRAGEHYDLRLECGYRGNAVAKLCWDTPELDRRAILPEFLHPSPGPKHDVQVASIPLPRVLADFGFEEADSVLSRSRAGRDVFGRLTGKTRRVAGKIGQAIEFESGGEFSPALFPIDEELRLADCDYTVAFWFKTTTGGTRLCEAKRYSCYNNRWSDHIVSLEGGKVRYSLDSDKPLESSESFNDGQWHHVATTVGSGGQRLYIDGKLIGTGQLAQRTKASNRLGLDLGPGGNRAAVVMDELKVFSKALTSEEIAQLRN